TDPKACEAARCAVEPVVHRYPPGTLLVPHGQPVAEAQAVLLRKEIAAYHKGQSSGGRFRRGVALFLVFSLLSSVVVLYVNRFQQGLAQSFPKVLGVCALVGLTLVSGLLLSYATWHAVLIPLT